MYFLCFNEFYCIIFHFVCFYSTYFSLHFYVWAVFLFHLVIPRLTLISECLLNLGWGVWAHEVMAVLVLWPPLFQVLRAVWPCVLVGCIGSRRLGTLGQECLGMSGMLNKRKGRTVCQVPFKNSFSYNHFYLICLSVFIIMRGLSYYFIARVGNGVLCFLCTA